MTNSEKEKLTTFFKAVIEKRDSEAKSYIKRDLDTCETIEEQIRKDDDLLISKARQSAFQEVLDLFKEIAK